MDFSGVQWGGLIEQGVEWDYRLVAHSGARCQGPAQPTSSLGKALLALCIVSLFSLFGHCLPHLPSSGFLEMPRFHDSLIGHILFGEVWREGPENR